MNLKRFVHASSAILGLTFLICGQASATLNITPLTWNIIGLDSNSPASGPRFFPVGARVCSNIATSNVAVNFVWDSANANVNLRSGTNSSITVPSIAANGCSDAYFEAEVTQVAGAFDTARRYHITATDSSGTVSTPTPRELYVEHLVSQNRNSITGVKLDGVSIPAGGSMNLLVGNTYAIELEGGTATQGYEQFEAFINFPNTIFQILSVSTTYSANTSIYVSSPNDKLYADACLWENDPTSPNYRACVGTPGKTGGSNVVTTYTIRIIGGAGTSQALNTLLYDFSGSSYHYNSDFSTAARIANIVDPTALTFSKAFSPSATVAGGTSTLTFTITNPTSSTVSGANFVDNLPAMPGQMVVATPATYSTSGCGSPSFTPVAGAVSVSFSNGTVAANSSCSVSVAVSVPSTPTGGTYTNTSNNLFIGTQDTGRSANANLSLTTSPPGAGVCGLTLARWNFPSGMSTTAPAPTTANVTAAAAAGAGTSPVYSSNDNTISPAGTGSWGSNGNIDNSGATLVTANDDYFEFALNTTGYSAVYLTFDALFKTPNGPQGLAVYYGTSNARPESGTQVFLNATAMATQNTWNSFGAGNSIAFTSGLNPSGTTYFRIYSFNAGNTNPGSDINIDNVLFTGCGTAAHPTLTKAFAPNPIAVNGTSTLTFTLTNPNTAELTGAKFTDALPPGLEVAATPSASTTCTGSPTWAPTAGSTVLDFGQTTGANIPAGGSCTASVSIKATTAGPHTNVSGFISTTESGTNSGAGGSATASLTAVLPPSIAKSFGTNPILPGGSALLTFTISNPNPNDALSGVAFSDTYPSGLVNANPLTPAVTNSCAGSVTAAAGGPGISLSGGTVAGGTSCTISVTVTAPTAGSYANTSGAVSATTAGTGNTATDTLVVNAPRPGTSLLKQISTSPTGPWFKFLSVAPGTSVYYQFIIENTGDVALSPVSVNDLTVSTLGCTWPVALPVASPTQDPTATCVVGPVTALAGYNSNTATAHGTYNGTDYPSAPSSADYIGASPGFSLLKQIGTSATGPWSSSITVALNGTVYYKFTLVNTGGVPLSPVSVTDPQVSTATCTFTDPLAVGGATTCVVGPVTASGTPGTYTNTATGNGTSGGITINTSPSSADYTAGSDPDLTISKTHSGNFTQGQTNAQYTITVTNSGSGDKIAGNTVSVTDTAPIGLTVTAMSGTGWTCTTLPTCTRSDVLTAGSSYPTITVTVSVAPNATTPLTNVASVSLSGQPESNTGNNTATDPTTIDPVVVTSADVAAAISAPAMAAPGSVVNVAVSFMNLGPGTATGVTYTLMLPAGLSGVSCSGVGIGCSYSISTGQITLTGLPVTLANGALISFTLSYTAPQSGTITATAGVNAANDSNAANNTANASTLITDDSGGGGGGGGDVGDGGLQYLACPSVNFDNACPVDEAVRRCVFAIHSGCDCLTLDQPSRASSNPFFARPLGEMLSDKQFTLQFELMAFACPVDIYIVVQLPDGQQLILNHLKQFLPFPTHVVPFIVNTTGSVRLTDIINNLFTGPVNGIPPGRYEGHVVVVPAGTIPQHFNFLTSPYYYWGFTRTF